MKVLASPSRLSEILTTLQIADPNLANTRPSTFLPTPNGLVGHGLLGASRRTPPGRGPVLCTVQIHDTDLRQEFMRHCKLVRAFSHKALLENDEYCPLRPFVDWLHYNGYMVVTKPAKEFTDSEGRRKVKGNMDIELMVDAMELAPRVDHIMLFTGHGDFRPLIESLQRHGVRVSVVSTIRSQPQMIAGELRRQADNFIELVELKDVIGRPPRSMGLSRDRLRDHSFWHLTCHNIFLRC